MLRNRAQISATTYQQAVQQTGGAIRPDKCRWYSITFKWVSSNWKYVNKTDVEPIKIEDSNGNLCPIQQLDNRTGWKGLGIIAAPNGKWKDHVEYLVKEKIAPWNASIKNSYLEKHDVYRAAFTSIFKSIDYTLPATSMTSNECKLINIQLHKSYLSRIGIDSHLPLAYRYSPLQYQGLNSLDVETKQFIEKLKIFITHAGTDTQLGTSIKIMLENITLMIGVNKSIFDVSFKDYGYLAEIGWIQQLWETSQQYGIKICGSYITTNSNRINDYALMEKILESDLYNKDDIMAINKCRIYLQVQNLSDITNGQGNMISYCAKNHIKDLDRISKYNWPNQAKPSKQEWEVWDDALLHVWAETEMLTINPTLGEWINTPFLTSWYYDEEHSTLYYEVSTYTYNVYKLIRQSRRNNIKAFEFHTTTNELTTNAKPAIVNRNDPFRPILETVVNNSHEIIISHEVQHHTDIFMKQINFPENIQPLVNQIKNGNAIAVTDASLSPFTGVGASSFAITTTDLQTSCCGSQK